MSEIILLVIQPNLTRSHTVSSCSEVLLLDPDMVKPWLARWDHRNIGPGYW